VSAVSQHTALPVAFSADDADARNTIRYPYFALWRLLEPDALSTLEALADFPRERRARHFIRRTKEELVKH
jgi:hypothetical protein